MSYLLKIICTLQDCEYMVKISCYITHIYSNNWQQLWPFICDCNVDKNYTLGMYELLLLRNGAN